MIVVFVGLIAACALSTEITTSRVQALLARHASAVSDDDAAVLAIVDSIVAATEPSPTPVAPTYESVLAAFEDGSHALLHEADADVDTSVRPNRRKGPESAKKPKRIKSGRRRK